MSHAGRIPMVDMSVRVPEDTYLFLKLVGFNFSARIRDFLEGEKALFELAEYRTDGPRRK
jgi:hypothetical protein